MRRLKFIATATLLGLLTVSCQDDNNESVTPNAYQPIELTATETRLAMENNGFAFRFFRAAVQTLPESAQQQLFVSPFSTSLALSMLTNGANGMTEQELADALGFSGFSLEEINGYNRKLTTELTTQDQTSRISLANSLWLNEGFTALDSYRQTLSDNYDAEVQTVDFATALPAINGWCSEKTNGLIPEILESLEPDAAMVLMNALYFKGAWSEPFDPKATAQETFYNTDGTTTLVELMHHTGTYNYLEQDGYQTARLPFGNGAFSLTILLPDEGNDLADCLANLDEEKWQNLDADLERVAAELDVKLPKFKTDSNNILNNTIKALGIQQAFSGSSDFSRLSEQSIGINQIRQALSFSLDEKGTEAAATTVIEGLTTGGTIEPAAPTPFHVQRPFLCILSEKSTGCILFIGKVEKM